MTLSRVAAIACLVALPRLALAAPLPEGDEGIAASHPGDVGIAEDPAVVFFDDFEAHTDASSLGTVWNAGVYQLDQIRLSTEPDLVFAGSQALELAVPQQAEELSNTVARTVDPAQNVLFVRFYSRFEGPFDVVGSSHNGAVVSSRYYDGGQATPGVPADGMNKFLVAYENWRGEASEPAPGQLNVYVYHPEQRSNYGDHFFPDGTITPYDPDPPPDYFGPDFVPRDNIVPTMDEWHCYEIMVQANTPGVRDGRIAFWFDGVLAADFENIRLRDVDTLTIDRFDLSLHIGSNTAGITRKWYDNVVAATSYIGPMANGSGTDDTGGSGPADSSGGSADSDGGSADGVSGDGGSEGATDDGASAGGVSTSDAGSEASSAGENDDGAEGCGCAVPSRPGTLGILGLVALVARPRARRVHPVAAQPGGARPVRAASS